MYNILNYRVSQKVCRFVFSNLPKQRNVTAISLILIPEYGQTNATGVLLQIFKLMCAREILSYPRKTLKCTFKLKIVAFLPKLYVNRLLTLPE